MLHDNDQNLPKEPKIHTVDENSSTILNLLCSNGDWTAWAVDKMTQRSLRGGVNRQSVSARRHSERHVCLVPVLCAALNTLAMQRKQHRRNRQCLLP